MTAAGGKISKTSVEQFSHEVSKIIENERRPHCTGKIVAAGQKVTAVAATLKRIFCQRGHGSTYHCSSLAVLDFPACGLRGLVDDWYGFPEAASGSLAEFSPKGGGGGCGHGSRSRGSSSWPDPGSDEKANNFKRDVI